MKIKYYTSSLGISFFKIDENYHRRLSELSIHSIDGIPVSDIQEINGWYRIYKDLKECKILKVKPKTSVIDHFKLINECLQSDKIPLTIPFGESGYKLTYDEDSFPFKFAEKFSGIEPLYTTVMVTLPEELETVIPELKFLGDLEISNFKDPIKMTVKLANGNYGGEIKELNLSSIVCYNDIERMLTPEFLIHERPCSLTSAQVYKIIRAHVKENIDTSNAVIDSDYDFCFSVNKKIVTKPFKVRREKFTSKGNSFKPPKFENITLKSKSSKIFSMTWAGAGQNGAGYNNYPVIEKWEAKNLKEMSIGIIDFLDDLMEEINKPVAECPECNGHGYIFNEFLISKIKDYK